ncbi:TlpA disulfide reductase family protein [Flavobacterium sp.]|uniref:TlpA family protein disulfide reductase n=1 Tax=Flavobacterium sp. TaxID=239 RepID=UPI00261D8C48|nr:TlpA disulfide reductase family protein [Flavobacterium sp.]
MKKLCIVALLALGIHGSQAQKKEAFTLQAEIANRNSDTIRILNRTNGKELLKIGVDKKGLFKGSAAVEKGFYMLYDGKEYTQLYLKNNFNLKLKMDAKQFDESIVYTGVGAVENNFLAQSTVSESKFDYNALLAASEADFAKRIEEKKAADLASLEGKKLDPEFVALQKQSIDMNLASLKKYHQQIVESNKMNGSPSPTFDYDNYKGGKTKLEDFRGKYVYIDVWATWCGPCRQEIPFLKKAEEKYHDKNIVFVSISIDKVKDLEKWKTMVKEKELGGVQVFADNDWNSKFVQDYKITGIPRFILVDPNGNIVKADAPRPSSEELTALLDTVLK